MLTQPGDPVVVVPVYVTDPTLYSVIESFFESLRENYPDLYVIGIDDGSPFPCPDHWPIKIRNVKNLGFTKTVNIGLEAAFKEDTDVVIVANDDLRLSPGDLDKFYYLFDDEIASPRDTASDPTDKWGAIWGIGRKAYRKLGPLDEQYVHFFSDLDYYERAKKAGILITKWDDIVVDHVESMTYKTIDKDSLFKADLERYESNSLNGK